MSRLGLWCVMAGLLWQQRAWPGQLSAPAEQLRLDFAATNGVLRPLHGVNLGPLCYRGTVDLSDFHRRLRIPLTRLHDVPWVNAEAVDVHLVFPDFRNDPDRPESYRFAATDDYIQAITNVQSQIVYRLGESIEHTPRKYHVHPPTDPAKWAEICLGIIRHYNDGWADGFRHDIHYWEIWNEPDVRPAMWTGTDGQYFELYAVTAKAIKRRFPTVKVGGPALGGSGQLNSGRFRPSPFLTNFLAYCRREQAPLDFFSWHCYTSRPWELPRRAQAIRATLDEYGFNTTESHLNEWNYLPNDDWHPLVRQGHGPERQEWFARMNGPAGAAFTACGLLLLQDAPVQAANYYTGEVQGFGLFTWEGVPKTTYYAFQAFRDLLDYPIRIQASGEREGELALAAGINPEKSRGAVLVSNFQARASEFELTLEHVPWTGPTSYEVSVLDERRALARVQQGALAPAERRLRFELEAPAVAFIAIGRGR